MKISEMPTNLIDATATILNQQQQIKELKTTNEELTQLSCSQIKEQAKQIKELKTLLSSLAYGERICDPDIMNDRIKQALKKD